MMQRVYRQTGFSFYEIVVALLVLSILALIALGRFGRVEAVSLMPRAEVLVSHIRYTQIQAMNSNTPWGIRYDASTGRYWLFRDNDITDPVALPGEAGLYVDLDEQDIVISQGSFSLSFDSWGRPSVGGSVGFSDRLLTLTFARPGVAGTDITVHQNTGFVTW